MDALSFFKQFGEIETTRVAELAGTTMAYFKQVMYGNRKFSHGLAKRISKSSSGRMTRAKLRPDIWGE
jgi:DNA-binding transcriptional regulator YdaS (Cro superfamily)